MAYFHPTYFGSIAQYAAMVQKQEIVFEVEDNYQKQSYRTRCYVYSANGKQTLSIPIKHDKTKAFIKTKDIRIENEYSWQKDHFNSLKSAYRSSPYFEFFEDDLAPFFEQKQEFLMDLLVKTHDFIKDALSLETEETKTVDYVKDLPKKEDFRFLIDAKKKLSIDYPKYTQVFDDKHGFIPGLSILDVLFMEGPNALTYLENLDVSRIP